MPTSDRPPASTPLRFCIAGCGAIAPTHARALAALPEAHLTTCTDIVPEIAAAFASEFGLRAISWDDALADPAIDAITICTPSGLHAELGVPALRAGKHVIVEKPMDISIAACDALIAAQEATGRILAAISQHRFDPASILARESLDRGILGPLMLIDARVPWYRSQEYYDSGGWRGTWSLDGGGCLMNQGVHTTDLMRWFGGPVATVFGQMKTGAHQRIEVEDVIVATLTFKSGALGTLLASTALYPGFLARLGLHGPEGSLVIEGDRLQTLETKGHAAAVPEEAAIHAWQIATGGTRAATANATQPETATATALAWGDAHRRQFADFIECCRTGARPVVDGVAGRQAVELVTAIYESARTKKVVQL